MKMITLYFLIIAVFHTCLCSAAVRSGTTPIVAQPPATSCASESAALKAKVVARQAEVTAEINSLGAQLEKQKQDTQQELQQIAPATAQAIAQLQKNFPSQVDAIKQATIKQISDLDAKMEAQATALQKGDAVAHKQQELSDKMKAATQLSTQIATTYNGFLTTADDAVQELSNKISVAIDQAKLARDPSDPQLQKAIADLQTALAASTKSIADLTKGAASAQQDIEKQTAALVATK